MADNEVFSSQDLDRCEPTVSFAVSELLDTRRERRLARRFERNGHLRRQVAAKYGEAFITNGGDPEDVQSFLEWLIAHADEIIAFISKLISLFTVT